MQSWVREIDHDGFALVSAVYSRTEAEVWTNELEQALARPCDATAIRSRAGTVYAARNLLELWPKAASLWRRTPLPELLENILGPQFGLVRALFFDKPPEQSWALPWHKDLTIAVREHRQAMGPFRNATRKAGVPHVEAPLHVLENMLTLRVHFDEVTAENGPLRVIPGSHRSGKAMTIDESQARSVLARQGDVLAIRPLVAHNSASSHPDNRCHRRILHLEFAGQRELPAKYEWHSYVPADERRAGRAATFGKA